MMPAWASSPRTMPPRALPAPTREMVTSSVVAIFFRMVSSLSIEAGRFWQWDPTALVAEHDPRRRLGVVAHDDAADGDARGDQGQGGERDGDDPLHVVSSSALRSC